MPAPNMTFESLKNDVRRYLERGQTLVSDPLVFEQIPRLINLAEQRIALELKIQGFIVPVTGAMQEGVSIISKPDRWKDTTSWAIGIGSDFNERHILLTRSYEFLRSYWPNALERGQPRFYADYDYNHWLVAPTPDADYPFEILYYQLPELLCDEVQSNWVTQNAPQLLLYGTLLEASPFLKNDERINMWQAMYDRAAAATNGEDIAKILDRASVRKEA